MLYPTGFFTENSYNVDLIKEICPSTDDLWLKAMGIINGYPAVKVNANSKEWFTLRGSQRSSLMVQNTGANATNDAAWQNLDTAFSLTNKLL